MFSFFATLLADNSKGTNKCRSGEETIRIKIPKRKANYRERRLDALERFANMKNGSEDWTRFRVIYPDFFPENLSKWLYESASAWERKIDANPEAIGIIKPPLLFYRDHLRQVWGGTDPEGLSLKLLLGFELEVKHQLGDLPIMSGWPVKERGKWIFKTIIPGQPLDERQQTTIGGLPPGRPIVDGVAGTITWGFGCELQQSVYELMQCRWRAKICPECGKFFLANKTRQTYCSPRCCGERKRKKQLEYWRSKGRPERDKRTAAKKPATNMH